MFLKCISVQKVGFLKYKNVTCLTHQSRPKQIVNAILFSGLTGVYCAVANTLAWGDGRDRELVGRTVSGLRRPHQVQGSSLTPAPLDECAEGG